ncbi:MAG: hypothetical protein NW200_01980 [Hyphomonadaceae bacterium]|nr:hypothetical protein [Hyphomonadaceae bacterium]
MLALCACSQDPSAPAAGPDASPQGVLSAAWVYTPATEETENATGAVEVEPAISAEGPVRTVRTARGDVLRAVLLADAAAPTRIAVASLAETLAQRPGARALLYGVSDGNLCLGAQATHVIWYEPEIIEGRALALAIVSGQPGESGSTVCRVLRYTRERSGAVSEEGP